MFPVKLAEYISEKKISVWNSVPSALSLLATYKDLDTCDLSSMRLILFAGELFPLKYLRLLQKIIPEARFCNMYGQTEANSSTYYWVAQLPVDDTEKLPIGKALPNFEVLPWMKMEIAFKRREKRASCMCGHPQLLGVIGMNWKKQKTPL